MAFNGSAHFKPGELVSYFESTGARLGPHVNAYTSFDETVYMLDLPTDKPEIVAKGLTALADFAGGLTLDPVEVDKERGVVIEEWRGGLGAGSRLRDKQTPILYYQSRYARRLPIGKPDVVRTAPVARLRAFYDTWYRPDHMALVAVGDIDPPQLEAAIRSTFSSLAPRGQAGTSARRFGSAAPPVARQRGDRSGGHLLVRVDRVEACPRERIARRRLSPRPDRANGRADDERALRRARQKAGCGVPRRRRRRRRLGPKVATFSMRASVQDGKIEGGLGALAVEARRVRDFGFGASELDRAKRSTMAFYERAYNERDKTESGSFAQEYLNYFLDNEPSPGIEYEYRLVQQVLPGITVNDVSAMARSLLTGGSRVLLAVSPQKPGITIPARPAFERR